TGCRFASATRSSDYATVGEHNGKREHVFTHRAVTYGVGPRSTCRRHTAERCVSSRVNREEKPGVAQMLVELLAGNSGLNGSIEIFGVNAQDPVHLRQVETNAAGKCSDVTLERGPGAERYDRCAAFGAEIDNRGDLVGAASKGDRVRSMRG